MLYQLTATIGAPVNTFYILTLTMNSILVLTSDVAFHTPVLILFVRQPDEILFIFRIDHDRSAPLLVLLPGKIYKASHLRSCIPFFKIILPVNRCNIK